MEAFRKGIVVDRLARLPLGGDWPVRIVLAITTTMFLLFLTIPLISLVLHESIIFICQELIQPESIQALELSVITTCASTALAVLFGLPVAYVLARLEFPGRKFLEVLVTLPTVLPPVVAGIALLLAFGRMGVLGQMLNACGITLPFTTVAVVLAQTFIAAPFFVNSAKAGLEQLDRRYELAASTLRAPPRYAFRHVVLPLIRPALLSGMGLAWARALGEFGATITFAGNFPGVTQTMPIAVYIASEDDLDRSIALAVVLLAVSCAILFALQLGHARASKQ